MDDATINPVGAYDPVARLPDGGGRGRQDSERKPAARRPRPADPSSTPQPAAPQPDEADPDASRGRRIDDHA